jgi:hypothetical protein
MKKTLTGIFASLLLAGAAQAAALSDQYQVGGQNSINLKHVQFFAGGAGTLYIGNAGGYVTSYADSGNTIYNKIKARADFSSRFVAWTVSAPYSGAYLQTLVADAITCSGSQTSIAWTWAGSTSVADGCALAQMANANAN